MAYSDYFRRPFDWNATHPWLESVVGDYQDKDSERFGRLYQDCFTHHFWPRGSHGPKLEVSLAGTYFLDPAQLTARFLEHHYVPPQIYATASSNPDTRQRQIRTLEQFENELCTPSPTRKGLNRFAYLIGDVGAGKSLLAAKLVTSIRKRRSVEGVHSVPVYVNLDELMNQGSSVEPKRITDDLLLDIATIMMEAPGWLAANGDITSFLKEWHEPRDSGNKPRLYFAALCNHLRARGLRPVIIIDNTDRYHFHYSKFVFCDDGQDRQIQSVFTNFERIVDLFTVSGDVAQLDLSVLLTCRSYVFRELEQQQQAVVAGPAGNTVYQIGRVDPVTVVQSRLDLLATAVSEIQSAEQRAGIARTLREQLELLQTTFMDGLKDSCPLKLVKDISHQGHRSFVDFLSRLKINIAGDYDVLRRVLVRQPYALQRLYVANLFARYTQDRRHFPNMFLNDTMITRDTNPEHQKYFKPHQHTYWLKYLILRYVACQRDEIASVSTLSDLFVGKGGYQRELFLLVLGSLAVQNESSCLWIDPKDGSRRVTLTDRGRVLAKGPVETGPFTFEVEYLQLVIDDYWLALPSPWYEKIFVQADLGYSLADAHRYGEGSRRYLSLKAPAVLYFLRVLEASLNWELKTRARLFNDPLLAGVVPNFEQIGNRVLGTYALILGRLYDKSAAETEIEKLTRLRSDLINESAFDRFFDEYSEGGELVSA
jgi:hypothetical protein